MEEALVYEAKSKNKQKMTFPSEFERSKWPSLWT